MAQEIAINRMDYIRCLCNELNLLNAKTRPLFERIIMNPNESIFIPFESCERWSVDIELHFHRMHEIRKELERVHVLGDENVSRVGCNHFFLIEGALAGGKIVKRTSGCACCGCSVGSDEEDEDDEDEEDVEGECNAN